MWFGLTGHAGTFACGFPPEMERYENKKMLGLFLREACTKASSADKKMLLEKFLAAETAGQNPVIMFDDNPDILVLEVDGNRVAELLLDS